MNVDLRQLRAFLAVARRGSFSRAAEDIGASQSALSLSVRQLETELGLKLLDRTTRQVNLTAVGERLVATSSRLIDELDSSLKELKDIGQQRRGRVVMACVPSVARSLMPKCVDYCAEKWPSISLSINDIPASEVVRRVSLGEMEFGLASGDIGTAELEVYPLMEDPFRLVCRRDDPWARKTTIAWAQLSTRRLLMLNNTSGSQQVIETTLKQTGTRVEVFLELAQPSSIHAMVEAGLGIAVVPELAAPRRDDPVLTTRNLAKPHVTRTILLFRRKDRSLSPAAAAAWSALIHLYEDKKRKTPV
ncbi:MAG: LysR family transcriptional regulator [Bradyrhizobiaceae bacterium]|nr:MAG: LysR family transcriptional regulator [Bradyrhizobiaceae bacterium]